MTWRRNKRKTIFRHNKRAGTSNWFVDRISYKKITLSTLHHKCWYRALWRLLPHGAAITATPSCTSIIPAGAVQSFNSRMTVVIVIDPQIAIQEYYLAFSKFSGSLKNLKLWHRLVLSISLCHLPIVIYVTVHFVLMCFNEVQLILITFINL